MEHTEIRYSRSPNRPPETFTGVWRMVDGGVVLFLSERASTFVPYHQIISIDQTFSTDIPRQETINKHLSVRLRK